MIRCHLILLIALIGVKHGICQVICSKSPGIKSPLKETSIVPNDFCRICRIDFKTSGRSKINVFGKNNKEFFKTLSSVLSSDVIQQNMMGVLQIICQRCQREVLQFLRVLEQLEKFWEKCNKALRIQLPESCTGNDRSAAWKILRMLCLKCFAWEAKAFQKKAEVTFTLKRLGYKLTFKGHSIIRYLNHFSTKDVINTQNQCQFWIYLKDACWAELLIAHCTLRLCKPQNIK